MVAAIGRGALSARSITVREQSAMIAWAEKKRQTLRTKLGAAATRGSVRASRNAIRLYRTSLATRLLALWHSTPGRLRPCRRLDAGQAEARRIERLEFIFDNVGSLACLHSAPEGRLMARGKGDGRYRHFFSFGWTDKARFRLLADALEPFVDFHASQYQHHWQPEGRGTQAAHKALLAKLNDLVGPSAAGGATERPYAIDDYVFVELDVRDFYGNIAETWWETKPILDGDMSRQLHARNLRIVSSRKVRDRLDGAYQDVIRRGLPQGSALSALVAEWVMADVLREVPSLPSCTHVFTYSDNIGILTPRPLADATEELIRGAFSASGAGSFVLSRKKRATSLREPFRFLGMELQVAADRASIRAPSSTVDGFTLSVMSDLLHAGMPGDFERLRRKVHGRAAAWHLWPDATAWRDGLLSRIDQSEAWLCAGHQPH